MPKFSSGIKLGTIFSAWIKLSLTSSILHFGKWVNIPSCCSWKYFIIICGSDGRNLATQSQYPKATRADSWLCYPVLLSVLTLRLENIIRYLKNFQIKTYVQKSMCVLAWWILNKRAHSYKQFLVRERELYQPPRKTSSCTHLQPKSSRYPDFKHHRLILPVFEFIF